MCRTRPRFSTSVTCWNSTIWRASCSIGSPHTCRARGRACEAARSKRKLRYPIAEKPSKLKQIKSKRELKWAQRWEHTKASLRAQVEHPFRVIKRQFGYVKVRYRGLAKKTAQVLTLFALSNLWLKRKQLLPAVGKVCL